MTEDELRIVVMVFIVIAGVWLTILSYLVLTKMSPKEKKEKKVEEPVIEEPVIEEKEVEEPVTEEKEEAPETEQK